MKIGLRKKLKHDLSHFYMNFFLICAGVFLCVLLNNIANAEDLSEAESVIQQDWQDLLVQDVLEQDIRQALRNYNEKAPANPIPAQSILAPRLVALYGVGKALMAEVQVGNQAYLYIRGQAYPAGYLGDKRVYQLKAMNGACIQLEKGQDRHSLCLRMLLGESIS